MSARRRIRARIASRGYIAVLGVRRPYRRRGLGEALLLHAFGALHARGRRGVDLHVDTDSLTGATAAVREEWA